MTFPHWHNFTEFTPVIPALYWDVESEEQRTKALCKQLCKLINYAAKMGIAIDELQQMLEDIEAGRLDPVIYEAIEDWFAENQPALQNDVNNLKAIIPADNFSSNNTVSDAITDLATSFNSDLSQAERRLDNRIDDVQNNLNNSIAATNGNVTALQTLLSLYTKDAVIVGDSWSTDNYGVATNGLWWTKVCKQLGVTPHNYSVSGMGYLQGSVTFWDRLQTAHDDTSFENSRVKYVFLQGSLNDRGYYEADANTYGARVQSTIARAKSYFPNAAIIVIGAQNPINANRSITNMSIVQRARCENEPAAFISMVWLTLGLDAMTNPDMAYHPTQAGQNLIAHWVLSNMFGTPILPNRDFALATSENARIAGTPTIKLRGNVLYLEAAGSSTADGWATLTFANNILNSLEYYPTQIVGRTIVDVGHAPYAQISTTSVQFRDTGLQGTNNNGWYYGIISHLY